MRNLILLCFVFSILFSCRNTSKSEEETKKDVSELTYGELYDLVLGANNGGGIDFHGEAFGMEAIGDLTIEEGNNCGENSCGKELILVNSNKNRAIDLVVKAVCRIPGNPNKEIIRVYKVEKASQVPIGCSNLCYATKTYPFVREILTAGYAPGQD